MPVSLSIKNVPEETVEHLRARAKQNHRSLQGELMTILEQAVAPHRYSVKEVYQYVQSLGLKTGDEAVRMIRETRDAR